jgi:hypothetical protein
MYGMDESDGKTYSIIDIETKTHRLKKRMQCFNDKFNSWSSISVRQSKWCIVCTDYFLKHDKYVYDYSQFFRSDQQLKNDRMVIIRCNEGRNDFERRLIGNKRLDDLRCNNVIKGSVDGIDIIVGIDGINIIAGIDQRLSSTVSGSNLLTKRIPSIQISIIKNYFFLVNTTGIIRYDLNKQLKKNFPSLHNTIVFDDYGVIKNILNFCDNLLVVTKEKIIMYDPYTLKIITEKKHRYAKYIKSACTNNDTIFILVRSKNDGPKNRFSKVVCYQITNRNNSGQVIKSTKNIIVEWCNTHNIKDEYGNYPDLDPYVKSYKYMISSDENYLVAARCRNEIVVIRL